jgi:succinylglutamate desuccinylase
MYKNIVKISSEIPGQNLIILAGVHGNEYCGVEAIKKITKKLKIDNGSVSFIIANPKALKLKSRCYENNLNRMFKEELTKNEKLSYEYKRATLLKKYMDRSDILLDLHSTSDKDSIKFIICENNAKNIVKYLPIKLVVSGFDNIEPGGTDYYMNKIGKIGICAECGYDNSPASIETATECIIEFIKACGNIIDNKIIPKKQSSLKIFKNYYTTTAKFGLSKQFKNFEKIKYQQIIGFDSEKIIKAPCDCFILFAENSKEIDSEVFLLGK